MFRSLLDHNSGVFYVSPHAMHPKCRRLPRGRDPANHHDFFKSKWSTRNLESSRNAVRLHENFHFHLVSGTHRRLVSLVNGGPCLFQLAIFGQCHVRLILNLRSNSQNFQDWAVSCPDRNMVLALVLFNLYLFTASVLSLPIPGSEPITSLDVSFLLI